MTDDSVTELDASTWKAELMQHKVTELAVSLWEAERAQLGSDKPFTELPEHIQANYVQAAHEKLLEEYVDTEASEQVTIANNAPDMFVFTSKHGDEWFRIIKNNAGDVDVLLDKAQTYTEAARAFLQIVFEQATKLQNLHFGRAFELMLQGRVVRRASSPIKFRVVGGVLQYDTAAPGDFIPCHGLSIDFMMADDWQVCL